MTILKGISVSLSTKVNEEALNLYLDEIKGEVIDTWDDVKIDYTSVEDCFKDKIDVEYLIEKGIIKIIVE